MPVAPVTQEKIIALFFFFRKFYYVLILLCVIFDNNYINYFMNVHYGMSLMDRIRHEEVRRRADVTNG